MNSSPETCNNNIMKRILLAACLLMTVACNSKTSTAMQTTTESVFGLGVPVSDNFTGEAWLRTLSAEPGYDCQIYNVTFAPSTRNYWHRHAVGQILLCTEGIGFYQEQGAPARRLIPGDVVNIPAGTIHWHGAAPDSCFTHIGITPEASRNQVEWLGEVTDEEYNRATE
jgi:quercetin dioxygenase-like cupin family protein